MKWNDSPQVLFDRVAPSYDRVGPPFFERYAGHLAASLDVGPGLDVLDLATGTGKVLAALAAEGTDPGRLVGVDFSLGMLLRAAASAGAGTQPSLARMEAARLAVATGSFDRVACGFAANLFERPATAFQECRRVLRPGGRVAMTTWSARCPYFVWLSHCLRAFNAGSGASVPAIAAKAVPGGVDRDFEVAELGDELAQAGFCDVEFELVAEAVAYPDLDEWWLSLWSHCFRTPLERLPEARIPSFRAFLIEQAQAAAAGGALEVRLEAWLLTARAR